MKTIVNSFLLAFLMLFACLHVTKSDSNHISHPLLFVPGVGGSKLYAKLDKPDKNHWYCKKSQEDWYVLWVDLKAVFLPWPRNCFVDNVVLQFDPETNTTSNSDGVKIKVDEPGSVEGMIYLDENKSYKYFAEMIWHLKDKGGYSTESNLMGVGYDWRKAPNENQKTLDDMKNITEFMYNKNGNSSVYIVSHSLGGLMTLAFLEKQSQSWKDTYIEGWISFAMPTYGAPTALELFASGYNFDFRLVPQGAFMDAERSNPSSAWILPNPNYWDKNDTLVRTNSKNYTVENYASFFKDINFELGHTMWQVTHQILSLESPGVPIYCMYGTGVDTPIQFVYDSEVPSGKAKQVIHGDGDGTVPSKSAFGCGKFEQSQPIVEKKFEGTAHLELLKKEEILTYLDELLGI